SNPNQKGFFTRIGILHTLKIERLDKSTSKKDRLFRKLYSYQLGSEFIAERQRSKTAIFVGTTLESS
ncbi:hypothetical protein, partial [Leptospira interrogans]|uniref:hypothetical protein n=1 Tax=Leptospira interrogans TaxID=173 RepID=UPI000680BAE0